MFWSVYMFVCLFVRLRDYLHNNDRILGMIRDTDYDPDRTAEIYKKCIICLSVIMYYKSVIKDIRITNPGSL